MSKKEDILSKYRKNVKQRFEMPPLDDIKGIKYPDTLKQFISMTETVGGKVRELKPGEEVRKTDRVILGRFRLFLRLRRRAADAFRGQRRHGGGHQKNAGRSRAQSGDGAEGPPICAAVFSGSSHAGAAAPVGGTDRRIENTGRPSGDARYFIGRFRAFLQGSRSGPGR